MTTYVEGLINSIEENDIKHVDILTNYITLPSSVMNSYIHFAMNCNNNKIATLLYSKMEEKTNFYKDVYNPIIRAIYKDDKDLVTDFLTIHPDINYKFEGTSLVDFAREYDSVDVFRILLQFGADTEEIRYKKKSRKIKSIISFWK